MKKTILSLAMLAFFAISITSCKPEKKEDTEDKVEETKKEVKDAAEETKEAVEEGAEDVKEATEEAAEDVKGEM